MTLRRRQNAQANVLLPSSAKQELDSPPGPEMSVIPSGPTPGLGNNDPISRSSGQGTIVTTTSDSEAQTTTSTTSTTQSPSVTPPRAASTENGIGGGAIAGVVIGVVVGIALLIALIFIVIRRRAKIQARSQLDNQPEKDLGSLAAIPMVAAAPAPPPLQVQPQGAQYYAAASPHSGSPIDGAVGYARSSPIEEVDPNRPVSPVNDDARVSLDLPPPAGAPGPSSRGVDDDDGEMQWILEEERKARERREAAGRLPTAR